MQFIQIIFFLNAARLPQHTCPDGWKYFEDKCYATLRDPKPWDQAAIECAKYDADILKVTSVRLNQFLLRKFLQHDASRSWMGLKAQGRNWVWLDGSILTLNELVGQTPNASESACVALTQTGKWVELACEEKLNFLCVKESKGMLYYHLQYSHLHANPNKDTIFIHIIPC